MENWLALAYSIFNNVSADDGLRKYNLLNKKDKESVTHNSRNSGVKRVIFSSEQLKKIYKQFKNGMSYKQMAEKYGVSPEAVRLKLYRYSKKVGVMNANV